MADQGVDGLTRLVRAFGFSVAGFKAAFINEQAFRQEVYCLIVLVPLGLWWGETGVERAILVGSLLLVPIVELLNSAVEAVVDRIGTEHHELSGRAKDIGSAAVLLSSVLVCLIWLLVLAPRYL